MLQLKYLRCSHCPLDHLHCAAAPHINAFLNAHVLSDHKTVAFTSPTMLCCASLQQEGVITAPYFAIWLLNAIKADQQQPAISKAFMKFGSHVEKRNW